MGAMKELLFDLAELQDQGVNVKSFEQVATKATGRLAQYVASIGHDRWPAVAEALVPAVAMATDEDGGVTLIEKLIKDLRAAKGVAEKAAEATIGANPHIANVLIQIVVETTFSITFLEGVIKAKDNL